jgi:hypothetical protein
MDRILLGSAVKLVCGNACLICKSFPLVTRKTLKNHVTILRRHRPSAGNSQKSQQNRRLWPEKYVQKKVKK